jgi:hypothetical protein
LLLSAGCHSASPTSSAPGTSNEVLVKVVQIIYRDEWQTVGETTVFRDGRYSRKFQDLMEPAPVLSEGRLPASILRELEQERAKDFKIVDGVATFEFGIEDSKRVLPSGVLQLLRLVKDPYLMFEDEDPTETQTQEVL